MTDDAGKPTSGALQRFAPLVLLGLALLVWFENWLPGREAFQRHFGQFALMRFAIGTTCVYVALMIGVQQRLAEAFRAVLGTFRDFARAQKGGAPDPAMRRQALHVLIGALRSDDPNVRSTAVENLRRLTGQDFGEDANRWREWIDRDDRS